MLGNLTDSLHAARTCPARSGLREHEQALVRDRSATVHAEAVRSIIEPAERLQYLVELGSFPVPEFPRESFVLQRFDAREAADARLVELPVCPLTVREHASLQSAENPLEIGSQLANLFCRELSLRFRHRTVQGRVNR